MTRTVLCITFFFIFLLFMKRVSYRCRWSANLHEVPVEFRVHEGYVRGHVFIQNQREHWGHCVDCGISGDGTIIIIITEQFRSIIVD